MDAAEEGREGTDARGAFARLLFPDPPRAFPGRRGVKIVLRAVHVLCAGVLAGAYLLPASEAARSGWLWATVGSGVALLLLDLVESGAFLLQVRGAVLGAKVLALALLPHLGGTAGWVLSALVLVSVVSSHAPSSVRYRLLFGTRRVRGASTRG